MKLLGKLMAAMLLIVTMSGCASTKAYFADRGHDALDIFTVTAGVGVGAKARVGPCMLGSGLLFDIMGLQRGEFYFLDDMKDQGNGGDFMLVFAASEIFHSSPYVRQRGLINEEVQYIFLFPEDIKKIPAQYFTQIEVACGLLGSVRFGFNPGELLDFLLGWFGIDIYGDDIEMNKMREERAKKPPQAPPPQDKGSGTDISPPNTHSVP